MLGSVARETNGFIGGEGEFTSFLREGFEAEKGEQLTQVFQQILGPNRVHSFQIHEKRAGDVEVSLQLQQPLLPVSVSVAEEGEGERHLALHLPPSLLFHLKEPSLEKPFQLSFGERGQGAPYLEERVWGGLGVQSFVWEEVCFPKNRSEERKVTVRGVEFCGLGVAFLLQGLSERILRLSSPDSALLAV